VVRMAAQCQDLPSLGVRLTVDVEEHVGARGTRFWARVRWVDPLPRRRDGVKRSHACREDAELWVDRMRRAAQTGVNSGQTLRDYFDTVGNRWTRGIDPTSTYDPYVAGLRRRVLPTLGHLPVSMISAGLVDRAIDDWSSTTVARL
jgi:hypothetical protein